MAVTKERIVELLEPPIAALGFELADLELHFSRGGSVLRLYIDAGTGVTLENCETVSRQVSSILDVADPMPGGYTLEVSSPGLDRRLVKHAHFDRFAGSEVQVKLRRLLDGRRRFRGTLLHRDGEVISILSGEETIRVPLAEVDVVRLVPDLRVPVRK